MPGDILIPQNVTSRIRHFMLRSSTTGQGLTGKVHSDFSGKYNIAGGTETSLSFSSGSPGDAYTSGKIVPLGIGKYAWHVPNALFASLGAVSAVLSVTGAIDVHFDWLVVTADRHTAAFAANTTVPDNAGIAAARTASESADGKLTVGRLSRVDRIPDVAAGSATGLAIVGSEMSLTSAVLAALFSDTDTAALVDSIIARIETDLDGADVSVAAIAVAVRDAVLNRLLAGNHDTAGTVGKLLQNLDVLMSSRATPAQVTAALDAISSTALARFATVNTGQTTAATGSVANLAQGAGGGGGSAPSVADIRAGLFHADDLANRLRVSAAGAVELDSAGRETIAAKVDEVLSAAHGEDSWEGGGGGGLTTEQETKLNETWAAAQKINGAGLSVAGSVTPAGAITLIVGKDYVTAAENGLVRSVADVGGALAARLQSATLAASLQFGARRGNEVLITGTISSVTYADDVTSISIEIPRNLIPGTLPIADDYRYQIQRTTSLGKLVVELGGALRVERADV
jgi:hypothetical protein